MKRLYIFILISFAIQIAKADATSDMKRLVNYSRMSAKHKKEYIKQREAQFESWQKHSIPSHFHIPAELQSYRGGRSTLYYSIYNYSYRTGVGYIPSNLVKYYEEEAWFAYKKYGKDAPSLSIILAQQFTESAFNPYAIGDNNKSYGLPQLHRYTAQYLYRIDKETWKDIFYFDKNGKHHFKDIRAMIKFPFLFLIKEKKYSSGNKFHGIRRYNGSGQDALLYAEKVIKRSLFYEELFAEHNPVPLDTSNFKENLFGLINLSLEFRGQSPLPQETLAYVFDNMLANFSKGYIERTYKNSFKANTYENKPLSASQLQNAKIPFDGKEYFLIVEDGNTLYSYFKDTKAIIKTLNHSKNNRYYIYYNEKRKKIKVYKFEDMRNKKVFTNVIPGNKIYIPPGVVIKKPYTNFAVLIKP